MDALLRSFNLSREACTIFDGGVSKFEVAAVCHEVRCVNTQLGETICMSLSDAEHRAAGEELIPLTTLASKTLRPDSVMIIKIWATDGFSKTSKRVLGEVRIPLKNLADHCDYMLYYTWVNLESVGLNDSMAHLGYSTMSSPDSFLQNIMSGPRQLFQPKACISICQAELATDRILWTPELPRKDRLIRWGPLLRSQQQHAVMCAAQHLEGLQQRNGSGHPQRLLHLRAQAEEQAQEIESLQDQLQSLSRGARESEGSGDAWRQPSMTLLEERTNQQLEEVRGLALQTEEAFSRRERDAAAQKDLADQKNLAATLQSELHSYEVELSKLGEEANNKIEAANVRIRALRREREEAAKALEERKVGNQKLTAVLQEIEDEKAQLTEQKEALIRIVEDLHSSCTQAGLQADRASIDSITGFKLPD